jgi:phosphonate transport system ATP-binding protein
MLMQRPRIVLADEPDASLDPRAGEEVMGLLYDLAKRKGATLVVISHRIEHTIRFSDRIVGLAGGRITLDTTSRTTSAGDLLDFFGRNDEAAPEIRPAASAAA